MTGAQVSSAAQIVSLSAGELSRAIHQRHVSCQDVMLAYLAQIDRLNPLVNAVVSRVDPSLLLDQARVRDEQLARGESLGWMHGFPIAVKDLAETRGIATTRGSPLFRDFVPTEDAIVVERMKNAGAVVIGKTNVPEFGLGSQTYNAVFGTTLNAYDQSRTAGGSSGGAAVGLALRMLPIADGSDMMGSLRNPAAFNNVFGFRPSQGRVPSRSLPDVFFRQLGTDGPMGRSVTDVALLLSVQAGFDPRAPLSIAADPQTFARPLQTRWAGTRIAWLGDWNGYLPMDSGVITLCESALGALREIGGQVTPAVPQFSPERLWQCWLRLRQWSVASTLGALLNSPGARDQIKPEALWEIDAGLRLMASDVAEAAVSRTAWYLALQALFEEFEFLILPTAQVFPFDARTAWPRLVGGRAMDTYHRWMEVVIGPTLAGLPVINVPVGTSHDGLPMGMQIIGKTHADFAVLGLAHAYDLETRWVERIRPPLL